MSKIVEVTLEATGAWEVWTCQVPDDATVAYETSSAKLPRSTRGYSSAWSELPAFNRRVAGSNPAAPTHTHKTTTNRRHP